jgi:hypothetical protein
LRAPAGDGDILAEPPLAEALRLFEENAKRLRPSVDIAGAPWSDVRGQARHEAVATALAYLEFAGEPVPPARRDRLILAGHQPELFHPGVWIKNFALNGLASACAATPINLIVDDDTLKSTALHVPVLPTPGGDRTTQALTAVLPYDRWTNPVPYEERRVLDEMLFDSLPERAAPMIRDWGFRPLLPDFWNEVRRQRGRTDLLGERFAAARRGVERAWGCHNFEVPLSALCRTESFARFAGHLLAHLDRFREVHNRALHAHRRANRIRSRSHPVSDLEQDGQWLEAPFWVWRAGEDRRGRMLVARGPDRLELRAAGAREPLFSARGRFDAAGIAALWPELVRQGIKVRSRAMTTTLYARVFLADLFIHGIGGAKYDEVTDQIIRDFYGFEPPGFMVLSGTLRLPLPTSPIKAEEVREIARQLRDARCNPQRHLHEERPADPHARELATQKAEWIARRPDARRGRRDRYHELRRLTGLLKGHVADTVGHLEQVLAESESRLRANSILHARDYAFCLYPEEKLRPFCTQFLAGVADQRPEPAPVGVE